MPHTTEVPQRSSVVLVGGNDDLASRSIETVLESSGYRVLRTRGGRRTLDMARQWNPDAIILDHSLDGISDLEVCRALRDDPLFNPATPIVLTAPAPVSQWNRRAAYKAGVWEYVSHPIDAETLIAKLHTFIRARRSVVEAEAALLVNPLTGLYTLYGLERWTAQLGALAQRRRSPLACVAVSPAPGEASIDIPDHDPSAESLAYIADLCRTHSRKSDVVGHLGGMDFVILAPDTGAAGASELAGRLSKVSQPSTRADAMRTDRPLSVGFSAVEDFSSSGLQPLDLIRRAQEALRFVRNTPATGIAQNFDAIPAQ